MSGSGELTALPSVPAGEGLRIVMRLLGRDGLALRSTSGAPPWGNDDGKIATRSALFNAVPQAVVRLGFLRAGHGAAMTQPLSLGETSAMEQASGAGGGI
jgi:hypothetical protein